MHRRNGTRAIIGVMGAVCIIIAFGVALYMLEHVWGNRADEDYDYNGSQTLYLDGKYYEITHNIETYLLIGTDDSGNVKAEGTKKYRGQMADFLLLYVMDKTDDTHGYLEIDRNTIVEVPAMDTEGNGEGEAEEQICTAHWYGGSPEQGCNNTVYCVSSLLGDLAIDGYYSLHMSDIGKLNHAVGGVTVTLKDDFSAADPEMTKGKTLTLNDEQAEIFVRGRMEVGNGTNEERMARQTEYMAAYKAKAKQLMEKNGAFINDLYMTMKSDAVTDIPENRISVIANQMYKGEDLGILKIDGKTKLGKVLGDGELHEEFYPDEKSIADCMVKLCGIDEDHITEPDDEDDEDYEEDEEEDDEDEE